MTVTITNVMAVSLDGRIGKHALESDHERRAYHFTNLDDREFVREQLQQADAVITGANSLRASGSTWRVTNDKGVNPAWVVFTTRGLDEGLQFWKQTDVQRVIVSPFPVQQDLCKRAGVENICIPENEPQKLLPLLEARGWSRVLLFGGGSINKLFYEHGLVDFAKITLCPVIIGGVNSPYFVNPGMPSSISLRAISSELRGDLVFLKYEIKK